MNYDEILNSTVKNLKPSGIRKFFDIVSEMPDAISLGVGEPDFVTAWQVRDAAIKSIQKGYTSYTSNNGLKELRKEIGLYLNEEFSLEYDFTNEIVVTIGASEAIDLALRAIISQGDEVLVPEPSYVAYVPNILLAGGIPRAINTSMANSFKLTPQALEAALTPSAKAIILPYPNNPTGAVMNKSELQAIKDIIIKHNLIVISDEIYAELTYGDRHVSVASLKGMRERTILISGFSKAFAMTGWRIGYAAAPKEILSAMLKIHQYTIMCAPVMSQYAALAALRDGRRDGFSAVSEMREKYDMRRKLLVGAFNKMGLETFEPKGAFYVFPCVKSTHLSGDEFATGLLKSQKVAVVPGSAFGSNCIDFVRCSYATAFQTLLEAVERIEQFVKSL